MGNVEKQSFDHLPPEERALIGDPDDYEGDAAIEPAPPLKWKSARMVALVDLEDPEAVRRALEPSE